MKVLVLNCGSSSIKYQMIDPESRRSLARGAVERIGMSGAVLTHQRDDRPPVKLVGEILDHIAAVEYVISILIAPNHGVIRTKEEIDAVGHRVVHGGEEFHSSVLITDDVLQKIRACIDLAPLHNPHNLRGIEACRRLLPGIPQVAVFDTAFHQEMPDFAYIYGIPYVLYRRYGIRRYGFHGTSHLFVSQRLSELMDRPLAEMKVITAHLGNGCSMAAIDGGRSVDTTMGFTPLEGLLMGTRSGDLDPAVILHIMAREELTLAEANSLLNKHSGLIGISGVSSDMREVVSATEEGNDQARLALDIFCYRIKKYIGAYAAAMGGLDAIAFAGGIGENAAVVRQRVCEGLGFLGVEVDPSANAEAIGKEAQISPRDSRVQVFVIPTDEELVIALDTKRIVESAQVN
jgi:acetate kinase